MKTHKAFTLIEVLLGIAIFSIISLCAYEIFWMGLRVSHKAEQFSKNYWQTKQAIEALAIDLENAFLYDFSGSYPQETSFKGDKDQVSFLKPTMNGIEYIHFYLNEATPREMFREEILLPDYLSHQPSSLRPRLIARGFSKEGLRFKYGLIKSGPQGSEEVIWKDTWQEGDLPDVVHIEMAMINPDESNQDSEVKRDIYLIKKRLSL